MALRASDIRFRNPHHGTSTVDYACIDSMFNALVRFKPEDVSPEKIEPDLAERSVRRTVWSGHSISAKGSSFTRATGS